MHVICVCDVCILSRMCAFVILFLTCSFCWAWVWGKWVWRGASIKRKIGLKSFIVPRERIPPSMNPTSEKLHAISHGIRSLCALRSLLSVSPFSTIPGLPVVLLRACTSLPMLPVVQIIIFPSLSLSLSSPRPPSLPLLPLFPLDCH